VDTFVDHGKSGHREKPPEQDRMLLEADLDAFMKANPRRSYTKTYVDLPTDKLP
jgi:hypothetical protein